MILPQEISKALTASKRLTHPLQGLGAVPLAGETLDQVLRGLPPPRRQVERMAAGEVLQQLLRGLYVTGAALKSRGVCLPLVAVHFYGSSCVSMDFALAWHGLIPEGVADVTSMTPRPGAGSATPWGASATPPPHALLRRGAGAGHVRGWTQL
jgi:hypothetical protein